LEWNETNELVSIRKNWCKKKSSKNHCTHQNHNDNHKAIHDHNNSHKRRKANGNSNHKRHRQRDHIPAVIFIASAPHTYAFSLESTQPMVHTLCLTVGRGAAQNGSGLGGAAWRVGCGQRVPKHKDGYTKMSETNHYNAQCE
jgi:hypothetical protein